MGTETLTPLQRVANGVHWLNEHGPAEWWNRVDLEDMYISESERCILGQVFAAAAAETRIITGYHYAVSTFEDIGGDPIRYGFCPKLDHGDDTNLEIAWLFIIDKIRAEVAA